MAKALVIVESPAKAKTITSYLGKGFQVKASLGHVMDLPKSKIGVDVDKDFRPTYDVIPGKVKVIDQLKKAAEKADEIYLATDPDREGEAICAHLKEILRNGKKGKKFYRVLFNEITKEGIRSAFEKPGRINSKLVDAQQARRILDRLVGYQISPLLWEKVRRGISAGRVQTVALRMIADREREILAFKSEEYWTMKTRLEGKLPPALEALGRHEGVARSVVQHPHGHVAAARGVADVDRVVEHAGAVVALPELGLNAAQAIGAHALHVGLGFMILDAHAGSPARAQLRIGFRHVRVSPSAPSRGGVTRADAHSPDRRAIRGSR